MKKYTAIALLLTAALTISACSKAEDNIQAENGGTPSQTATENTSEESGGEITEEDTEEQQPEPEIPEDVQNVMDTFEVDSFTTPDGTEVKLTEASSQMGDIVLCFDFAYIRYALPIYSDTVIDPGLYDFENFKFRDDVDAELEQKPFKVVVGDVLDNGMTVTEVNYAVARWDTVHAFENDVWMEGECELEGILYRAPEDDYMIAKDEVLFWPNPTDGALPALYEPYFCFARYGVDLHDEFAFMNDGGQYSLGDVHEMDVDIADWFEDTTYVRAKVTLDGIHMRNSENFGSQYWSTLKSAEILNS